MPKAVNFDLLACNSTKESQFDGADHYGEVKNDENIRER